MLRKMYTVCVYTKFLNLHRKKQTANYEQQLSLGLRKRNERLSLFTLTISVLVENFYRGIHNFHIIIIHAI